MTENERRSLACELSSLCVFRGILNSSIPLRALYEYLNSNGDTIERLYLYSDFVSSLMEDNGSFSDYLSRVVFADENQYIINRARGIRQGESIAKNAAAELELFSKLCRLTPELLCGDLPFAGHIPQFDSEAIDFQKAYEERLMAIERYGYGIFSQHKMFRIEDGNIVPLESADRVSLDSFVGYEDERQRVFDNTRALCEGKKAANVLLFGDAGTGKSSTVKACANYFADSGLRLIEIRKDQLFSLSHIMDRIKDNPLRFIIFIDDLSFNKNDDCFSMLKAALEGSASAKAENAVIYATSNRRHIVKENFSDREGAEDVHHNDTVQELLSLSDRFGLTVYFGRPNKSLYLEIVKKLAVKHGLRLDEQELCSKAEVFALARGSRSPRAAEQFIESLK